MATVLREQAWIFGARPNPTARVRLYCFPSAGGGASAYCSWVSALAPQIAVYPVQLPGRENRLRERPFLHFSDLIQALSQAILPHLTGPFAFYGHSMGALISFALAAELRRQHRPLPEHLFLSSYRAPQIPNDESLHTLPDDALVRKVLELDGTSPELMNHPELRALLLPIMRADFSVCESFIYAHEEPLDCPLTVFGGLEDNRVSCSALEAWREQTRNTFSLHMMPGGHFFLRMMQQPLLQIIARALDQQHPDKLMQTSV